MPDNAVFRVDILPRDDAPDAHLVAEARVLHLDHLDDLKSNRYYLLKGDLDAAATERLASSLLADPVTERFESTALDPAGARVIEVQKKPGVMDPVEVSVIKGAKDLGIILAAVRVGRRVTTTKASDEDLETLAWKCLANQAIEEVAIDPAESLRFPTVGGDARHERTEVPIRELGDEDLVRISREGCLSLSLAEMKTIQAHFVGLGREPTDVELESLAQTWSEHCVHKTLKGVVDYEGPDGHRIIDNLLASTIARATKELDRDWCISVFKDNSGIIDFDDDHGVCIKVETHNHPSAIDPYGGANTGIGGVIRDIMGTGLGAKPIFNTDVFCFGELDTDRATLPPGTIHPLRLMKQVVAGVRDYGNRMGIPTVNGCVRFDPRYVGNPLVFCGTGGLIPKDCCFGDAEVGDHILVMGGRTGRDGIHGATFSSIELSEDSEMVSCGAVQIGNAIEEKKVLDTFLAARDAGCFHATTDCGAGGISSAIGEMGEALGVEVHLERMPLKYDGLSYCEIWISEAQERMVAAVSEDKLAEALAIFTAEDVEVVDVGVITGDKRLHLKYHGVEVADLEMDFLHNGIPRTARRAVFAPPPETEVVVSAPDLSQALLSVLARPNVASKEWVIRQYDHEVQGGSIIKPLVGVGRDAPSDAAIVAPQNGSDRGVAVACGLNTCYGAVDAYHAAAAGIEEAMRNLACVGAPIDKVALLDNFSWGSCDKPENLGALVRACEACYDLAMVYGAPFVSGKDSLNNEYSHGGETIIIPHTLLITAMTVMGDVTKAVTMELKRAGEFIVLVGVTDAELGGSEFLAAIGKTGGRIPRIDLDRSKIFLDGLAAAITTGKVTAAHDCSDGGLGVCLAEMAFGGDLGMEINLDEVSKADAVADAATLLFSESLSRAVITCSAEDLVEVTEALGEVPHAVIGSVTAEARLSIRGMGTHVMISDADMKAAWKGGLDILTEH